MNTYNDNLHSSVVASLNSQELELKNVKAALDTSAFTLYYAEGARITANEQLQRTKDRYKSYQELYDAAVVDHNISVNVKAAADDLQRHNALAVSNMAVAASNVQVASNAILRLASTVGGIHSIVNAADFGKDIYDQGRQVHQFMIDTAYEAELASDLALQASALIAEVPAITVAADAKTADDSIAALLKALTDNFNATAAEMVDRNAQLAAASDREKEAEGKVEYINADYFAARSAYKLANAELNLGLKVPAKSRTENSYTVSFLNYHNPFIAEDPSKPLRLGYPVKDYYIILVKNRAKTTFTIQDAEALQLSGNNPFIKISGTRVTGEFSQNILINALRDSDNDPMTLGAEYVVFLLIEFLDEYKRTINNFNNYLTAPSESFSLTINLESPATDTIKIIEEEIVVGEVDKDKIDKKELMQVLTFQFTKIPEYEVEYRCMFLPDNSQLVADLLTEAGLRKIEDETRLLEKIADSFVPKIKELNNTLNTQYSDILSLEQRKTDINKQIRETENLILQHYPPVTPEEKKYVRELEDKLIHQLEELALQDIKILEAEKDYKQKKTELKNLTGQEKKEIKKLIRQENLPPGFFFNLKLAEQVSSANYIVPTDKQITPKIISLIPPHDKTQNTEKKNEGQEDNYEKPKEFVVKIPIGDNITDNFGNPLIKGISYIPVVLTWSTELDLNFNQFRNSLSDFANTHNFTYEALHKVSYTIK
ncbi:MAG: hypothetical protein WDO19_15645 [Bacteroidota bacterium]